VPTHAILRPHSGEYAPYYEPYIAAVPDGDLLELLERDLADVVGLIRATPESRGTFRYEPDKWSVNDVINHIIDAERIYTYRALRIARGDQTPLPGWDENVYAVRAGADHRTFLELSRELEHVRYSAIDLFRSLPADTFAATGIANEVTVTVRALAYILAGHARHHVRMLRERYGL
jgi:hypothetical protein